MKTTQLLIITFLLFLKVNTNTFAQETVNKTAIEKNVDSLKEIAISLKKDINKIEGKAKTKKDETPPCEKCAPQASDFIINIISFSPLALFLFIFSFVFIRLRKEGYKISDALKENETIPVSVPNPFVANTPVGIAPTPFVEENIQPKSSSRLIAFITALITIGIAASFCTFWLYTYLKCGFAPSLENITNVILALGLGVVPYAFNKISSAIK
ncbi:hypothetical protein [Flavobacterium sp.]|uniref:hypothetical protein n=1 Tax=Flavobacterium sp. TaxID=239 RepID=UPI0026293158|nr:hypothetical protein [Flavobacterium sp.]